MRGRTLDEVVDEFFKNWPVLTFVQAKEPYLRRPCPVSASLPLREMNIR